MLVPMTKAKTGVLRYLEDFKVGEQIETETFTLTRDNIVAFAEEYDPQDMHIDEELAKGTIFGQLVGSGWQTLLITLKLILNSKRFGDTPLIGAGFKDVRFHHPRTQETAYWFAQKLWIYVHLRTKRTAV